MRGEVEGKKRRGRTGCCGAQKNKRCAYQQGKTHIGVCASKDPFFFFCFQPDKKQYSRFDK